MRGKKKMNIVRDIFHEQKVASSYLPNCYEYKVKIKWRVEL